MLPLNDIHSAMKYSLLLILAAIFGASVAFGLFEIPKAFRAISESKNNLDLGLITLGIASSLWGVYRFLFDARGWRRNSWPLFAGLGAVLIYAEIFNVAAIKFSACEFILQDKHRHTHYESNGTAVTPEQRCKNLVY